MLLAESVHKSYGPEAPVLKDLSLRLPPDETLSIVGPSGCGKTTLLYMLCGLLPPDRGTIKLNGHGIDRNSSNIAIILQDYGLLPWRTALENVALGLKIKGTGKRERNRRAGRLLAELRLSGREHHYPSQLSGGEQQRVAIARALALEPRLLLMDEPFSSLDAITREKLQELLLETWNKRRIPYVLITHSVEEAVFLGRRVIVLGGRPAGIIACFDNDGFGHRDYRCEPSFYDMIRKIRKTMVSHW